MVRNKLLKRAVGLRLAVTSESGAHVLRQKLVQWFGTRKWRTKLG